MHIMLHYSEHLFLYKSYCYKEVIYISYHFRLYAVAFAFYRNKLRTVKMKVAVELAPLAPTQVKRSFQKLKKPTRGRYRPLWE